MGQSSIKMLRVVSGHQGATIGLPSQVACVVYLSSEDGFAQAAGLRKLGEFVRLRSLLHGRGLQPWRSGALGGSCRGGARNAQG